MLKSFHKYRKDELIRGSITLIVMMAIFNLLNYLFQISMARFLGPADYGILAALMSIVYIFAIPSEAIQTIVSGYTSALNIKKEYGKMKDLLIRSTKKVIFFSALFFFIFSIFSYLFLSNFLKIDLMLLLLTGLILFATLSVIVPRGILQGRKKFFSLGLNLIFESTIKIIFSIILVLIGLKVYGGMAGVLIGVSGAIFLSFIAIKEVIKSKRVHGDFGNNTKNNYSSLIAISAIVLMYSLDIIFARALFTPEIAGQYAFVSLIGKVIVFSNLAIGKAMFPISSESAERGIKTHSILKKSLALVSIICIIALLFFLLAPEFVIRLISLGSDKYLLASGILFNLGLAFSFTSFSNLFILNKLANIKNQQIGKRALLFLLIFPLLEIMLMLIFSHNLFSFSIAILVSNLFMMVYTIYMNRPMSK